MSSRSELLADEVVSMRHLCRVLGAYDKYLVAPRGSDIRYEGFSTVYFDPKFFGTAAAHNPLLHWPGYFETFADYEYILIYHLDCLVFSDQLLRWCDAGYDYIGAPWLPCKDTPWVREPRVGNGGFSLMNVDATLAVLRNRYRDDPATYWSDMMVRNEKMLRPVRRVLEVAQRLCPGSTLVEWPLRQWRLGANPSEHGINNDYLWSFHACRYLPTFRVAPVSDGLRFAFEADPRLCFELNDRRLPFGCHAWPKFDRGFWEKFLIPPDAVDGSSPQPSLRGCSSPTDRARTP